MTYKSPEFGGVAGVSPAERVARNNVRAQGETSPSYNLFSNFFAPKFNNQHTKKYIMKITK